MGLADRVEALCADLAGTDLEHWRDSLKFLAGDMRQEAGAEATHEVAQDGGHGHIDRRAA